MQVELNQQEIQNIITCMDITVRQQGLQAASGLLTLAQKLSSFLTPQASSEPAKEVPVEGPAKEDK